MFISTIALLAASAATASAAAVRRSNWASVTPHEQFSSSIGVLGCFIDTNRVGYWPMGIDCDNLCVQLTYNGQTQYMLKIDESGGAYDVSYDLWNTMYTGQSATVDPQEGNGLEMEYEFVDMGNCYSLLDNGKLPLSAANSMNYLSSCLSQPNSWVANNYILYNLVDSLCEYGYNEVCWLEGGNNQPTCPHQLGVPNTPTGLHVYDIAYGTGVVYAAS